jgi:hypothetical protein
MTEYQGHPSWNAWNVALWISSTDGLYRAAAEAFRTTRNAKAATTRFFEMTGLEGKRTPDGARYSKASVTRAIIGLEIERN